jgi:hypothetical protein
MAAADVHDRAFQAEATHARGVLAAGAHRMNCRPEGLYWVRFYPDDVDWQPALFEAGQWFLIGVPEPLPHVKEVGPAIPLYRGEDPA